MRAIILISALFVYDALYHQSGVNEPTDRNNNVFSVIFWVALIYAIAFDVHEW